MSDKRQSDFLRSIVDPEGLKREEELHKQLIQAVPEREVAKGCPRCAELSESLNNRAREQAQKTVNNEVSLDKLATLEAEKEEIKQAIRWAPSSAHWSNVLIKLCGEDSRDGINALEKQLREAQTTIAQQAEQLAAAESRLHDVATHCATVEQQLAAAEKDAERYRWLRSNHPIHDNSPFICRNFGAAFSQWTGDQADKAIDAAIAASREGKS